MSVAQPSTNSRQSLQRIAVAFFVLFALAVLDLVAFTLAESRTVFKVVAGRQVEVSGKLPAPIDRNLLRVASPGNGDPDMADLDHVLTYQPADQSYTLHFTGIEGRLWRGLVRVEPFSGPADHAFQVLPHGAAEDADVPTYHLFVYPDEAAYRRSFLSLTKRWTGVDPLWTPLLLLPAGVLLFIAVFRAAREEDRRLQAQGIGPIYKLALRKNHWEVLFGLGSRQGIRPGDTLVVLDARRRLVGEIVALEVAADHATATMDRRTPMRPDYLVGRAETMTSPSTPAATNPE
ncbi:MAG: hypothetical protein WAK57_12630 [Desulfobacterales bacterium]